VTLIRAATLEDLPALVGLEKLLFGVEAWSEAQVRAELTGPGREVLVACEEDAVIGYVITLLVGEVADLQRIGVHPARQRQGLAAALLARALERPAARMLLEVAEDNEAALAFYAQHGFVEIGRRPRYYRSGAAAIVMEHRMDEHRMVERPAMERGCD